VQTVRTAQNIPEAILDVLQDALDRPIAFHRVFVKLTGSVTAALMLSQAVYWTKRANSGGVGWFYKTITQWEEETGLSRHEQETARKALRRFSFWQEERRGVPAQMYYRVDIQTLSNELLNMARSPISPKTSRTEDKKEQSGVQSRLPDSGKLDCGNTANKDAGKRQTGMSVTGKHYSITETTTEITTETTTTPVTYLLPGKRPEGRIPQAVAQSEQSGGSKTDAAVVVVDEIKKLIINTPFQTVNEQSLRMFIQKYGLKYVFTSLDMLIETYKQIGKPVKNPGAILSSGLMRGVTPPSEYVPYQERIEKEKKAKETAEQRRIAAETIRKAEEDTYNRRAEQFDALPEKDREMWLSRAKSALQPVLRTSKHAVRSKAIELSSRGP
jgi:hypothetical protein